MKMKVVSININWSTEWQSIKTELAKDIYIHLYILLNVVTIYSVTAINGYNTVMQYNLTTYLDFVITTTYISFVFWSAYYYLHMLKHRTPHPLYQWLKKVLTFFTPISKPIAFISTLLSMSLTLSSYTYVKSIIPDIHPFEFDHLFYQIDKFIHFGISPWRITHFIFSGPISTLLINTLYNLWAFCIWAILVFFIIYRKNQELRLRFFLSFISCWLVLGGLIAILFSSAGPCYTELLNPHHTYYQPLINQLNEQNQWLNKVNLPSILALNFQEHLWQQYIHRNQDIGSGISAMPSMHVSMAVLFALSVSNLNKIWGYVAWIYAAFVEIGSVHLAWHYAIDGYTSAALTVCIWFIFGKLTRALTERNLISAPPSAPTD